MAIGALVGLAFAVAGAEGQLTEGVHKFCDSGRQHTVTYAVKQKISDDDIFSLNSVESLSSVQCDLDGSKVKLTFAKADAATKFVGGFSSKVMVGSDELGCTYAKISGSKGVMLKHALTAAVADGEAASVHIITAPMSYTQVYEKMNISYHSTAHPDCEAKERRLQFSTCPSSQWCCKGLNGDQACIPCKHTLLGHCNDIEGSDHEETCAAAGLVAGDNCHAVGPTPAPGPDHDKKFCLGVNADTTTCTNAAAPVPIYSNSYIDVKCKNCFVGIRTDIFFNINLDGGYLHEIQAGYRNTGIHTSLELEIDGQASWSTGIDKQIWEKSDVGTPAVHFNVGPIPFLVWFETSGQFKADISMDATAVAIAGVAGDYNIGDNYLSWDLVNHWQHVQAEPSFTHTTQVQGDGNVKTHADTTFTAVATMHIDKLFSSTLTFAPGAKADVNGDASIKTGAQVCEDASYAAALALQVELKVDLPFHIMDVDKTWSKNLWNIAGQLPKKCQPVGPFKDAKEVVV